MNPDRVITVCALVAGITASLVGGLAAIILKLVLDKMSDLSKRLGLIEGILIGKGLHKNNA